MALRTSNKSIFRNVDYSIIIIYALLVIAGAISIYAASYDFDNASMLDLSEFFRKTIRLDNIVVWNRHSHINA